MFFILFHRVGRAHYIRNKYGRGRVFLAGCRRARSIAGGAVAAGGRGDLRRHGLRAAGRMICRRRRPAGFLRSVGPAVGLPGSAVLVRLVRSSRGWSAGPIWRGWSDLLQADGRRATAGGSVRSSRGAFLQADGRRATAGGRRGRRRCAASSVASCSLQAWQVRPGRIVAGGRRQRQRRRWLRRDFRRVAARRINSA